MQKQCHEEILVLAIESQYQGCQQGILVLAIETKQDPQCIRRYKIMGDASSNKISNLAQGSNATLVFMQDITYNQQGCIMASTKKTNKSSKIIQKSSPQQLPNTSRMEKKENWHPQILPPRTCLVGMVQKEVPKLVALPVDGVLSSHQFHRHFIDKMRFKTNPLRI